MTDIVSTLEADSKLSAKQEKNLVSYIAALPRDACFGLVKSLVTIPDVAAILCKDEYDSVVLEAINAISEEAS